MQHNNPTFKLTVLASSLNHIYQNLEYYNNLTIYEDDE